ncbi:MAG: hypothetical protein JNL53_08110 [Cyclobacteriaceae bacterium]|nr:hypothetical protein [Cyclobacteriaceae bacterium]
MNTSKKNQNHERSNPSKSKQPIPFNRRGLNEDEQKRITNADDEEDNSTAYISTNRQDKKVSTREPENQE